MVANFSLVTFIILHLKGQIVIHLTTKYPGEWLFMSKYKNSLKEKLSYIVSSGIKNCTLYRKQKTNRKSKTSHTLAQRDLINA